MCVFLTVLSPEGYRAHSFMPTWLLWKQQSRQVVKLCFETNHRLIAVIILCFTKDVTSLLSIRKCCDIVVAKIQKDLKKKKDGKCFGVSLSQCKLC